MKPNLKPTFELNAQSRETSGKGASRRLRRLEQLVPAIMYGANEKPQNIQLQHKEVVKALENEATYSHILTLNIDNKKQQVVLKDLQRHVYKPIILHMDFLRIDPNAPLHMHIPLHVIGEAKNDAILLGGAVLAKQMVEVEVVCLPKDLPEYLEIDITDAPVDTIIHLSEIKLPKNVEIAALTHGAASHDTAVLSIHMPRRSSDSDEPTETVDAANVPSAKGAAPAKAPAKGAAPAKAAAPAKPAGKAKK